MSHSSRYRRHSNTHKSLDARLTFVRAVQRPCQYGCGRSMGLPYTSLDAWAKHHATRRCQSSRTVRQRTPLSYQLMAAAGVLSSDDDDDDEDDAIVVAAGQLPDVVRITVAVTQPEGGGHDLRERCAPPPPPAPPPARPKITHPRAAAPPVGVLPAAAAAAGQQARSYASRRAAIVESELRRHQAGTGTSTSVAVPVGPPRPCAPVGHWGFVLPFESYHGSEGFVISMVHSRLDGSGVPSADVDGCERFAVKFWMKGRVHECVREVVVNRYLQSRLPPDAYQAHVRQYHPTRRALSPMDPTEVRELEADTSMHMGVRRLSQAVVGVAHETVHSHFSRIQLAPPALQAQAYLPCTWSLRRVEDELEGVDDDATMRHASEDPALAYTLGYSIYTHYSGTLGVCLEYHFRYHEYFPSHVPASANGLVSVGFYRLTDVMMRCMQGLLAHHNAGVLLVDIKPDNIFLSLGGRAAGCTITDVVFGDYGHATIIDPTFRAMPDDQTESSISTSPGAGSTVRFRVVPDLTCLDEFTLGPFTGPLRTPVLRGHIDDKDHVGTIGYSPPESLTATGTGRTVAARRSWTHFSDIYALGITFAELLACWLTYEAVDPKTHNYAPRWRATNCCLPEYTSDAARIESIASFQFSKTFSDFARFRMDGGVSGSSQSGMVERHPQYGFPAAAWAICWHIVMCMTLRVPAVRNLVTLAKQIAQLQTTIDTTRRMNPDR